MNRAKWGDWADTMDLYPRFHGVPASTLSEWAGASSLGSWHATRTWLRRQNHYLERLTPERLVARASLALRHAAMADPQLSSDAALDRCRSRMFDAVHTLALNPLRGVGFSDPVAARRLHAEGNSAYQLKLIG
jgi:hypothetical protein